MLSKKESMLLDAIESAAEDTGIEIVTLEIVGAKKSPVIRVYVDSANGVSFNELSSAQAWIGDLLDEIDPFPGAYTLEVSSPGIDRPLRTTDHFRRFIGEEAKIRLISPVEGSSNVKGIIKSVEEDKITIENDGSDMKIDLNNISKANLIGKIEF